MQKVHGNSKPITLISYDVLEPGRVLLAATGDPVPHVPRRTVMPIGFVLGALQVSFCAHPPPPPPHTSPHPHAYTWGLLTFLFFLMVVRVSPLQYNE